MKFLLQTNAEIHNHFAAQKRQRCSVANRPSLNRIGICLRQRSIFGDQAEKPFCTPYDVDIFRLQVLLNLLRRRQSLQGEVDLFIFCLKRATYRSHDSAEFPIDGSSGLATILHRQLHSSPRQRILIRSTAGPEQGYSTRMLPLQFILSKSGPVTTPFHSAQYCCMTRVAKQHRPQCSCRCSHRQHGNRMIDRADQLPCFSEHRHVRLAIRPTIDSKRGLPFPGVKNCRGQRSNRLPCYFQRPFNQVRSIILHQCLLCGIKRIHRQEIGSHHGPRMCMRGGNGNL